jgi:hypothetical protein
MNCECGLKARQTSLNKNSRHYSCICGKSFRTAEYKLSTLQKAANAFLLELLDFNKIETARRVLREKGYLK